VLRHAHPTRSVSNKAKLDAARAAIEDAAPMITTGGYIPYIGAFLGGAGP
jgi:hypothetical protein